MPFHYKILLFHLGAAFFLYFSLIGLHGNRLCKTLQTLTNTATESILGQHKPETVSLGYIQCKNAKTRRAAPAPSARRSAVEPGGDRGPRFPAGCGGDVAGRLRGEGASLSLASPSRSPGTPETKNKINKLSPPPPSPKTTTQTLGGPPTAPLHWPQAGCL